VVGCQFVGKAQQLLLHLDKVLSECDTSHCIVYLNWLIFSSFLQIQCFVVAMLAFAAFAGGWKAVILSPEF
jgi:hypothetical protein